MEAVLGFRKADGEAGEEGLRGAVYILFFQGYMSL